MTKDISEKVLDELMVLRRVDVEKLAAAVAAGESFYGEEDISLPQKEG